MALQYHQAMVHYLRKDYTFADVGSVLTMGEIPAGSVILKPLSGVDVQVAFNAATTNTVDMGTSADPNLYGTALAAGSIAFVPLDEAVSMKVAADTTITVSPAETGTASTAGAATAVLAFIPPTTS